MFLAVTHVTVVGLILPCFYTVFIVAETELQSAGSEDKNTNFSVVY